MAMQRWVKAFREGTDAVQDNLRTGQPHMENNTVQFLVSLLGADRWWTAPELAEELGVCHKSVLIFWVTAHLKRFGYSVKFPRCNNGTAKQSKGPCWTDTKGKVTIFLDESSLRTKSGLTHTNQTWNANQMNGSIPVHLVKKKCALYNVLWSWCSFLRMILMGNTAPRCTYKADSKRCLLLHVPAVAPSSSAQDTTTILGGTEPHRSSWSLAAASVTKLLRRWQWEIPEHPPYSPIRVHVITISSPKWKNHCGGPRTTQEMNLSVL